MVDGVHHEPPEPRVGEHRLHHDDAPEEEPDVDGDDADGGEERVAERVPHDHPPRAEPAEPGGADEGGVERLDHAGPGHPRHVGEQGQHQGERGQRQAPRAGPEPRSGIDEARRREQGDAVGEQEDEHGPRDELGKGHGDQGDEADRLIEPASAAERRQHAERDGERHRDPEGQPGEHARLAHPLQHEGAHRDLVEEGRPPLAPERPRDPVHVADGGGPIEAELDPEGGEVLGRGRRPQDHRRHVAGQPLDDPEDENRHDEHHQRHQEEAPDDEGQGPHRAARRLRRPQPSRDVLRKSHHRRGWSA